MTLAALLPLLAVLVLLGTGRANTLQAGSIGLALTLVLGALTEGLPMQAWLQEGAAGAWMALRVVVVILAGLFFARCLQTWPASLPKGETAGAAPVPSRSPEPSGATGSAARLDGRTLWVSCFALGPFVEAVTGFGVGYLILLVHLQRLGLSGMPLLLFGLYSQTLVPWGALAVGTVLGAQLAGISVKDMGANAALLQAPMHLGYLMLYWRFARQAGLTPSPSSRIQDLFWTALLLLVLWGVNRTIDLEIGGVLACGLILLLHEGIRPAGSGLRAGRRLGEVLHDSGPLVLVAVVLCLTRVPPVLDALRHGLVWQPLAGQPEFHPLASPALWLVICGLIVLVVGRVKSGSVLTQTLRLGWRPALVTLVFVLMAQCYVGAGFAHTVATGLQSFAGPAALLMVPVFAAIAGFLTGTGAASNAMLMGMVTALATQSGVGVPWMAAVQATVSTNLTLLSPMRIAMGIAFDGGSTIEAALYRRARMLALPAVLVGLIMVTGLLLE
ncbi:MAG: L-lactate permease [Burkholderiaceae bacterium]